MKREKFADELYFYMQDRILEIINKFGNGNYNDASYPAFMIGAIGDINTFLEEKDLRIRKSYNQQKKDKDDGSNDTLSGDTKQLQGQKIKDEHMPSSVDNHAENPQDDLRNVTSADKRGTGDGTFPGDLKSKWGRSYVR